MWTENTRPQHDRSGLRHVSDLWRHYRPSPPATFEIGKIAFGGSRGSVVRRRPGRLADGGNGAIEFPSFSVVLSVRYC